MTRVLLVSRPATGGAARHVLDVVRGLSSRYDIVAACSPLEGPEHLDRLSAAGARVVPLPMTRPPSPTADVRSLVRLRRLLREGRFDLVHAHASKAGALVRLAGGGVPVVYSPHGFYHLYPTTAPPARAAALSAEKRLARRTSVLAACSRFEAEAARVEGLGGVRATLVVPPGVAPPAPLSEEGRRAARAALGAKTDEVLVLMAGRLVPPKAPELFLKAARGAPPTVLFALAGGGPRLSALRERAGTDALVLGPVPGLCDLLPAVDVAVLASRFEAAPYFVLEAMAAGRAVVCTDLPATREMLGDAGVCVPADAGALREAILSLAFDVSRRQDLGARAKRRAEEAYSTDGMLLAVEEAWRAAIAGAGPEPRS